MHAFLRLIMTIDLKTLDFGTHNYEFALASEYFQSIEKSEILGGNVAGSAQLMLQEDGFNLSMQVNGTVQVVCDRCLDAMDVDVDAQDEDIEVEEGATTLDLDWLAYELIVINLPLVHCHQQGECNPEMEKLLQQHLTTAPEEDTEV